MLSLKFLVILGFNFLTYLHPVHVSILNFDYAKNKQDAEISLKVFTDDFELAFIHNYNLVLNLGKENMHPEWKKYLDMYFSKMFLLKTNNKKSIPLVFNRYELRDDGIMLYFTAPVGKKLKSIQMSNGILLDVFENQTNLVIFSIDGKEQGYSLNFSNYTINMKL